MTRTPLAAVSSAGGTGTSFPDAISQRMIVSSTHTVADDIVYDLISLQYHALKGAEAYDRYLDDAHSSQHSQVSEVIEQCKR